MPPELHPVVRVQGLHKQYDTDAGPQPVLKDVSLTIMPGEFVALMGPSGSGKTTFMNLLGCLDTPTQGSYWLDGQDTASLSPDSMAGLRNRFIGFVFQGFNLLPRVSLQDNVALPLLYAGVPRRERQLIAAQLLKRVGLERYADYFPNHISGGQQQRVAIARALANSPKLLLADEPTGNLDTHTSAEIMDLFTQLNASMGLSVVLVTHELDIARHARRLVNFVDGRISYDGPTEEFVRNLDAVRT
ncbi:MAG: ABC transporter ATP-binding protein [Burkholderiales bacterium]